MKRHSQSEMLARLAAFALIFIFAVLASGPQAKGSGPNVAVTVFANDASAPQSTVDALGAALYAAVDQSGRFTAVGGGPLDVKNQTPGGDLLVSAMGAAQKVQAEELITAALLSTSGGAITYRLSAYRVAPLAFIRSQIFTQSSTSPTALRAGFVTDLATLHAPRTASGTIYSLTGGIKADFGEVVGVKLGDIYNVVRNSQKMAQARVVTVDLNSATIEIFNESAGYKAAVGDQLIGVGPQPPIPPAPPRANNSGFTIIGILAATGAALFAIGHHGLPAGAQPLPSPTSSGARAFTVVPTNQTGTAPIEQFTFTFNQPVNVSAITFANGTFVSVQVFRAGTPLLAPNAPVTALGGPPPSFNALNTGLTINTNTTIQTGDSVVYTFNPTITSTGGQSLTTTTITFIASGWRHPAPHARGSHPAQPGGVHNPAPGHGPQPPGDSDNPRHPH